jgi:hypothetical protein
MAFKGKAPGSAAGEMSKRTEALRPPILLTPKEVQEARRMRRSGMDPHAIAETLGKPMDEVEKALVQMRMPRPESTRGTLNITLAAHNVVMKERRGNEPLWQTFDRIVDELLQLRAQAEGKPALAAPSRSKKRLSDGTGMLPLLE